MKVGFDNEKYLKEQSEEIRRRAGKYGRLYLEFGGKLMNDFHAARCLPGYHPNVKLRLLQSLKDQAEVILCIYSGDIENEGGYIYKDENGNLVTGYENSGAVRQNLATGVYQSLKPDANTYCPTLNFSAAEIEALGEIRNNLKTFVNQQRTLYVLGQEASFLDDKDAFLAELNNIGLERFLELADVAYQRQYVD